MFFTPYATDQSSHPTDTKLDIKFDTEKKVVRSRIEVNSKTACKTPTANGNCMPNSLAGAHKNDYLASAKELLRNQHTMHKPIHSCADFFPNQRP